ncbi:MAG: DUF4870 domain-containing protein [Candidatus Spyradocola sp.]|nr:DUF4870 domain-containing protein [Candidatus Spyradocola sp.]
MANILDMPDTTSYYSRSDIEGNKLMAVLSYLGILVLIPILAAKDSPFAKFHATQGLNLLIVSVAWSIVSGIIGAILGAIGVTFLSVLWSIITWLVSIVIFLTMVIGIINAAQGKAKELPIIGGFRILK